MPSERRIWLSSRATVVLPVPGLPVNTRWWLVSSVGMPRSSRSCWIRSRLVSRRTSALTSASPTSASSSASSSSIGRAGGSSGAAVGGDAGGAGAVVAGAPAAGPPVAALAGRATPAASNAREQHVAEVVDGGDLVGRRHEVERRRGVGEADAEVVVARRPRRAVAGVGPHEEVEQRARAVEPRRACRPAVSLSRSCVRRHEHRRLEPGADVVEPRLQLGGRVALVAVDDGGHEVGRLDDDVAAVVAARQLAQLGADAVDERVDVVGEDSGHGRGAYRSASRRASGRCDVNGAFPVTRVFPIDPAGQVHK